MVERVTSQKEHEIRPQRRLVVTGMGAITPLGRSSEESWQNALRGVSCATRLPYDEHFESLVACLVDYRPEEYFTAKELRRMHRSVQFTLIAVREALMDAQLLDENNQLKKEIDPFRIGVRIGTGSGGADYYIDVNHTIEEKGANRVNPFSVLIILPERVTSVPSMCYGLKAWPGTNIMACATGAGNIADAGVLIQANKADIFLCGGAEAAINKSMIAGFANIGALSKKYNDCPEKASRPFDQDRDGFVPGEGAVVLVLEEMDSAVKRGARIYAELTGMWLSADAQDPVQPDPETVSWTIDEALKDAKVEKSEVDLIVAHATSTKIGDPKEIEALRKVFGSRLPEIPITAPKSTFGHLLGAAGSLTAMIAVKSIAEGKIPPTINLENVDTEFTDLHIVNGMYEERDVRVAIANAFGFGGENAVLVFKKYLP